MTTIPGPLVSGVLAHQGGWDEIAMVLVPIAVFGGLLVVMNRRTDQPPPR